MGQEERHSRTFQVPYTVELDLLVHSWPSGPNEEFVEHTWVRFLPRKLGIPNHVANDHGNLNRDLSLELIHCQIQCILSLYLKKLHNM